MLGKDLVSADADHVVQPAVAGMVTHVRQPADNLASALWMGPSVSTAFDNTVASSSVTMTPW